MVSSAAVCKEIQSKVTSCLWGEMWLTKKISKQNSERQHWSEFLWKKPENIFSLVSKLEKALELKEKQNLLHR